MEVAAISRPQKGRRIGRTGVVVAAAVLFAAACAESASDNEEVSTEAASVAAADTSTEATSTEATPTETPSGVPAVVATTGIWADVVSNVGCENSVSVTSIIPQSGDPHTFEPSLRDRETMDEADLVVANGLGLEERLTDTLEAVAAEGVEVFEVAEHINTIEFEFSGGHDHHDDHGDHKDDDHDHHEEDTHDDHDHHKEDTHDDHDHDKEDTHDSHDHHKEDTHDDHGDHKDDDHDHDHDHHEEDTHDDHEGHDHSGGDPHFWFDLQRVAGMLGELADELIHAGANADTVNRCLEAYRGALEDADAEVAEILNAVPADGRILITNHDAFGYFADRYGFEVVGTVIPSLSTTAETNPALLEELAEIIEHEGVSAVFSETTHSDDDIQALATAAGDVAVVSLLTGSLAPEGQEGDTLIGMLRFNARAIANALS